MKELSLKDIQEVSLDILKEFHTFCVLNDIKYSIGYGTAIGAIRHGGFIPWDDDVDVVMMRDDFNRFCELYNNSSKYKLFSLNRNNSYAAVARLCEMEKTFVETGTPLFTERTGVWIDIFPYDSVDDDISLFQRKIPGVVDAHNSVLLCRYRMRPIKIRDSYIETIKSLINWFLFSRNAKRSIWKLVRFQNSLCTTLSDDESHYMSLLAFPLYIKKDHVPKSVFEDVIDISFEKEKFKIMKGYDLWLSLIYGDYMTPPPLEKQKRGHQIHKYYWKSDK